MTNLLAIIAINIVTNWEVHSVTYPQSCEVPNCCVYHIPTQHQIGRVMSNTVATINWGGRGVVSTLDSVEVTRVKRDKPL